MNVNKVIFVIDNYVSKGNIFILILIVLSVYCMYYYFYVINEGIEI